MRDVSGSLLGLNEALSMWLGLLGMWLGVLVMVLLSSLVMMVLLVLVSLENQLELIRWQLN